MPNVKVPRHRQGGAEMSTGCGVSRFLKLIRHARKGADHDHRLCMKPSTNDFNQAANGIGVFYRRTAKLQNHEIFSRFKSASLRQFGHKVNSDPEICGHKKTHRQLASGGGFRSWL